MTDGAVLILRHCEALGRLDEGRPTAADRLYEAIGDDLARLLVFALAPGQGRRGSSSP
jgi:hypothetical protein